MPGPEINEDTCAPGTLPEDVVQTIDEISRQLSQIVAHYRHVPQAEALRSSQEKLESVSRELRNPRAKEAAETKGRSPERLRREILDALKRGGPALFPELAAATLSLPDEIQPVLQDMVRDGLVEIQNLRGWKRVSLTARGRQEAKQM